MRPGNPHPLPIRNFLTTIPWWGPETPSPSLSRSQSVPESTVRSCSMAQARTCAANSVLPTPGPPWTHHQTSWFCWIVFFFVSKIVVVWAFESTRWIFPLGFNFAKKHEAWMNIRCSVHMIRKYVTLCRKKTPSEAKQSSKIKNYYNHLSNSNRWVSWLAHLMANT